MAGRTLQGVVKSGNTPVPGATVTASNPASGQKVVGWTQLNGSYTLKGDVKAYKTSLIEVQEISVPNRHAAVFQLDVPLSELKPGFYTCQINVIDDAAGHFVFPRVAMLLRH